MSIVRLIAVVLFVASATFAADNAPATNPSVPKGEVTKHVFDQSKIFPGTTRAYWVYVPKQYDGSKPACLFIDQDDIQFKSPAVFDELINSHEMPVAIGIYVAPGVMKATSEQALDRFNRSYEFDAMSDEYARFLLEELLPSIVADQKLNISNDPNDRCIAGTSSGAICAFTAAWERNDSFRRVFSGIGTYVDLRGGNIYPSLIRKFEPKPIRIFLVDGSNDNNHYGGDWWMANQEMERALTFCGYEVNHVWGTEKHNSNESTAAFADAMRWMWKDWPTPVKAGAGSEKMQEILIPGEGWKSAADFGGARVDGPVSNAKGEVLINDTKRTVKIGADGKLEEFAAVRTGGQAFGPDGKLYASSGSTGQIISFDAEGHPTVITEGIRGNDLVVAHNGNIYVTESGSKAGDLNQVWLVKPSGEKEVIDTGIKFPNGICLSPDQSLLYVDDYRSHWVYSYQIKADGALANKQRYFHLHRSEADDDAGADGMRVDRDGRLYVATRAGIQICDQAGRVNCIIPTPNGRVSNLCFGDAEFDTLFATCGDKVFKRKLKVKGALNFEAPIKPAKPKL